VKKRVESTNPWEGIEEYSARAEKNRVSAYENKLVKKILTNLKGSNQELAEELTNLVKHSETPLLDIEHLFAPFKLYPYKTIPLDLNSFFKSSSKSKLLTKFSEVVKENRQVHPDSIPAMAFFVQDLGDLVIHTGVGVGDHPSAFSRLIRRSTSGDGGFVVDSLNGFLSVLQHI